MERIQTHRDLKVYQLAFEVGMDIFNMTKYFPKEETFSLTDQIRRSSRSVSGNIAEAFRKRRYPKAFISKLSDAEREAAESQVWLDYSLKCGYINKQTHKSLNDKYDHILAMIIKMVKTSHKWSF